MRYDPGTFKALSFHDAVPHFSAGRDTPRAYLERCLAQIANREPRVMAFAAVDNVAARAAADASSARWKAGRPWSVIDGMPMAVGIESPAVRALREAGAVILGRTLTVEPTRDPCIPSTNPFDATRTAGASSAAAVAACHCPVALADPACGRVIRSASYCGNFALAPTPRAPSAGERPASSSSPAGVHTGSIEDLWHVAMALALALALARLLGGDPGQADSAGGLPEALRPRRLIVIESALWHAADGATRRAFEALMDQIACTGVTLLRRRDHPGIEAFEQALVTADDDHALQRRRSPALHATLAPLADAVVMFSAPGPAPLPAADPPDALQHAPSVSVPLMGVDGMPVGARLVGQRGDDARLLALARWVAREAGTVVV